MALNPIVYTEKVVRSFLRNQLTAFPTRSGLSASWNINWYAWQDSNLRPTA